MTEPESYSVRLRRVMLILLVLCTAVAMIRYGQEHPAPTARTDCPATH